MSRLRSIRAVISSRLRVRGREARSSPPLAALLGIIVCGLSFVLVNPLGVGAYHYGRLLFVGATAEVLSAARTTAVTFFMLIFLLYVFRGATNTATFESTVHRERLHIPLCLHTYGVVLSELASALFLVTIPAFMTAIALSLGGHSLFVGMSTLAASASLTTTAVLFGLPLGIGLNTLLASVLSGRRIKFLVGLGVLLLYEALILKRAIVVSQLVDTPLSTFGRFALAGSSVFSLTDGLGLPLLALVVSAVLVAATTPLVTRIAWRPTTVDMGSETEPPTTFTVPSRFRDTTKLRRVFTALHLSFRSYIRSPTTLLYATFPALGLLLTWYSVFSGSRSIQILPIACVTLGLLSTGVSPTLNALGIDADILALLFSGNLKPDEYFAGKLLTTLIPNTIVFVPLALLASHLAGYTLTQSILLLGILIPALLAGGAFSVALGIRFPNTDSLSSRTTISIPARTALASYSVFVFALSLIAASSFIVYPDSSLLGVLFGAFLSSIVSLSSYQYANATLQCGPLEPLETRTYPSLRDSLSPGLAAFWECFAVFTAAIAVSASFRSLLLIWLSDISFWLSGSFTVIGYAVAVFIYLRLYKPWPTSGIGLTRCTPRTLLPVAVTVVCLLLVATVTSAVPGVSPAASRTLPARTTDALPVLLIGVLLVPVGEEVLYRGVFLRRFSEVFSPSLALSAASAFFVLPHLPLYVSAPPLILTVSVATVFAQSVLLGALYLRTRTLVAPILAHVAYNAVAFLPVLR
ncbi:type II CAAX endopeptidase family protein [Salarchaeum sp. III]|uniref:CPBP family intramembrane glutamic endopeptidase n=1 Tax=Salarchaeum sp. III TaxID=3107927 RepID=UPI002EDB70BF